MMERQTPSFITIESEYRTEYIIDKSRFIATIKRCNTEGEAQEFIQRISKEFWDATHNCTAFAIGPKQEQQRSSDNGEPSGTAGKPMLEVLKKTGITNAAVVVTRYFGGIKLGAGGLIRAYSHSVSLAVQEAPKLLVAPRQLVEVTLSYALYGGVERFLDDRHISYTKDFGQDVTLVLYVEPQEVHDLEIDIQNLTNGDFLWNPLQEEMVELPYTPKNIEE